MPESVADHEVVAGLQIANAIAAAVYGPSGEHRQSFIERFWAHVEKRGPDDCWLWTGPVISCGYGQVSVKGIAKYAHRLSLEIASGPIPGGLFVLHRCDVPRCVNPAHLFLGTQKDNINDAIAKGRIDQVALANRMNEVKRAKPNCKFGHPFDRVTPRGRRYCSICVKRRGAIRTAKRRLLYGVKPYPPVVTK